jgi:methyltransferase-like protein 6
MFDRQHAVFLLQVGCGVGNSIYPLLDINPQLRVYACDFSATAVQIVQQHPQYAGEWQQ